DEEEGDVLARGYLGRHDVLPLAGLAHDEEGRVEGYPLLLEAAPAGRVADRDQRALRVVDRVRHRGSVVEEVHRLERGPLGPDEDDARLVAPVERLRGAPLRHRGPALLNLVPGLALPLVVRIGLGHRPRPVLVDRVRVLHAGLAGEEARERLLGLGRHLELDQAYEDPLNLRVGQGPDETGAAAKAQLDPEEHHRDQAEDRERTRSLAHAAGRHGDASSKTAADSKDLPAGWFRLAHPRVRPRPEEKPLASPPRIGLPHPERVRLALEHRETDRVPIAMVCSGINPPAYRATEELLRRERGISVDAYMLPLLDIRSVAPAYAGPPLPPRTDIWGVRRMPVSYGEGEYDEIEFYPLAGAEGPGDLDRHRWPTTDWFDYSVMPERIAAAGRDGDYCLMVDNGNI